MRYYTTIIILVAVFLSGCASLTGQHRRTAYVNGHPNVPVFYAQAIKDGAIMVGMTKDQVSASWGNPCGRSEERRVGKEDGWGGRPWAVKDERDARIRGMVTS